MILKGKKTILRPMKVEDAYLTAKWGSDPEINKYGSRKRFTLKEAKKWVEKDLPKDKNYKKFAITTKDGQFLGNIGLWIRKEDNWAEYDIIIGDKKEWGKGYGYDASKTILDYGFNKLKLHRIYLHVYSYTDRASKLYKKLGFKKEGMMRESVLYKGKYYDKIIMSLLAKEWKNHNP